MELEVFRVQSGERFLEFGELSRGAVDFDPDEVDFVSLDAALTTLAARDPRAAKVVEMRFFAGLSVEDTAAALDVSERTVAREWNVARAWLTREMAREG